MRLTATALSIALIFSVACSTMPSRKGAISSTVFGTITFPENTTPPAETVLLVSLVEIASDSVLARMSIRNVDEDPLAFSLQYNPDLIRDTGVYGVVVGGYVNNVLRYHNDPRDARVDSDRLTQTVEVQLERAN
jgi:uncharacterized lipoprotein YbaY